MPSSICSLENSVIRFHVGGSSRGLRAVREIRRNAKLRRAAKNPERIPSEPTPAPAPRVLAKKPDALTRLADFTRRLFNRKTG